MTSIIGAELLRDEVVYPIYPDRDPIDEAFEKIFDEYYVRHNELHHGHPYFNPK